MSGLESRFLGSFVKKSGPTSKEIENNDYAGSVASKFRDANANLQQQRRNIDEIFGVARGALNTLLQFQTESGHRQLNIVPLSKIPHTLPYGKKMGVIRSVITFLTDMLIHSLEENIDAHTRISVLNSLIERIADEDDDINEIGMVDLALGSEDGSDHTSTTITQTRENLSDDEEENQSVTDVSEENASDADTDAGRNDDHDHEIDYEAE
jgi:hypothetical protein